MYMKNKTLLHHKSFNIPIFILFQVKATCIVVNIRVADPDPVGSGCFSRVRTRS